MQTFSLADLFDRKRPLVNQRHRGVALKDIASWPPGISLRSDQTSGPSRIRSPRRHARFTNQRRELLRFVPDLLRLFLEELLFPVREILQADLDKRAFVTQPAPDNAFRQLLTFLTGQH